MLTLLKVLRKLGRAGEQEFYICSILLGWVVIWAVLVHPEHKVACFLSVWFARRSLKRSSIILTIIFVTPRRFFPGRCLAWLVYSALLYYIYIYLLVPLDWNSMNEMLYHCDVPFSPLFIYIRIYIGDNMSYQWDSKAWLSVVLVWRFRAS